MLIGITINREFLKIKKKISALWTWGVLKCLVLMLYARVCFRCVKHYFVLTCTILKEWEQPKTVWLLTWVTIQFGNSFSYNDWQFCSSYYWQPVYYCMIFFRISHRLFWRRSSKWVSQKWEKFCWRKNILCRQWVVNQQWLVFEPKVKTFWKIEVLVKVYFQQKWLAGRKQSLRTSSTLNLFNFEVFKTLKISRLWIKVVCFLKEKFFALLGRVFVLKKEVLEKCNTLIFFKEKKNFVFFTWLDITWIY